MNAKKISTFEREHSSNGNPRLHNVFGSPVKKSEHEGKKSDSVKKAVQGKKSDFSKKKVKNREKNKMTNFPTKNQKQVAFFTGRFFYPALLAALFIPYMVT